MAVDPDLIRELLGAKREKSVDTFNMTQALSGMDTAKRMDEHARRMGNVQDAYWKSKCPDYTPPTDDEVGNNYLNCTWQSDEAIRAIAGAISDRPSRPWLRWLIRALLLLGAVILGAILIWLTLDWFGGANDYELFAEQYQPTQ